MHRFINIINGIMCCFGFERCVLFVVYVKTKPDDVRLFFCCCCFSLLADVQFLLRHAKHFKKCAGQQRVQTTFTGVVTRLGKINSRSSLDVLLEDQTRDVKKLQSAISNANDRYALVGMHHDINVTSHFLRHLQWTSLSKTSLTL